MTMWKSGISSLINFSQFHQITVRNLTLSHCRCVQHHRRSQGSKRVTDKIVLPEYSTLDELLYIRRKQAQHSVFIQHSSDNLSHVFERCAKYGPIKLAFSYQRGEKTLLLVEFDNQTSVGGLLSEAQHFNNNHHMPIDTPFLILPRKDNGSHNRRQQERLQPEKDHILYREIPRTQTRLEADMIKAQSMSAQIAVLHSNFRMSDLNTRERFMLCHLVEGVLCRVFGECQVLPFGSSFSGFGKHDCDLDMVCDLSRQSNPQKGPHNGFLFLSKLRSEDIRLEQQNNLAVVADIMQYIMPQAYSVKRILRASVPIIRFTHSTSLQCDISMENRSAYYMTELLHLYGELDNRVRPLVFAVRYWARQVGLTATPGGPYISNFMLTLLTVFYLQQGDCPLLPSVTQLKNYAGSSDTKMVDGEDCTFISNWSKVPTFKNTQTLEELFRGFLQFYENFDFASGGVDIVKGATIEKPDDTEVYVVNPIERQLNVCKNVSQTEINRFKEACQTSLQILDKDGARNLNKPWGLLAFCGNSESPAQMSFPMNIQNIISGAKAAVKKSQIKSSVKQENT